MSQMNHANVEFEAGLLALRPRAAGVDRDAVLFAAGRSAGRAELLRHRRMLFAGAAAGWLAAFALGGAWVGSANRVPPARAVAVAEPQPVVVSAVMQAPAAARDVLPELPRREAEVRREGTLPASMLPEWSPDESGSLTIRGFRETEGAVAVRTATANRPSDAGVTLLELRRRWSEELERKL